MPESRRADTKKMARGDRSEAARRQGAYQATFPGHGGGAWTSSWTLSIWKTVRESA